MAEGTGSSIISEMLKKLQNTPSCEVRPLQHPAQPSPARGVSNMKNKAYWGKDLAPFGLGHAAGPHFPDSFVVEWDHMTGFWAMKCEQMHCTQTSWAI